MRNPQVNLLVFDAAPEPFDKHVVALGTLAIYYRQVMQSITEMHDDINLSILQDLDELDECKLASLVGIHNLRLGEYAHGKLISSGKPVSRLRAARLELPPLTTLFPACAAG